MTKSAQCKRRMNSWLGGVADVLPQKMLETVRDEDAVKPRWVDRFSSRKIARHSLDMKRA